MCQPSTDEFSVRCSKAIFQLFPNSVSMTLLCKLGLRLETVHISLIVLMLCAMTRKSHPFRICRRQGRQRRQRRSLNRNWTASASSSVQAAARWGRYALSNITYLVHHIPACDAILTEILRKAISKRYLSAVSALPHCSCAMTVQSSGCETKTHEERETQVYDRSLH